MNTRMVLTGHILEETSEVSLSELCRCCNLSAETMIKFVEQGVISPVQGQSASQWRFHSSSLVRADKAMRLKRDLNINLAGSALVLELLDEINQLRAQLQRVELPEDQ